MKKLIEKKLTQIKTLFKKYLVKMFFNISILILFFTGCVSSLKKIQTDDFLTQALEHPLQIENVEYQSRYWVFNKYLVHFITNIDEKNKKISPIIYIHGLGGSVNDYSELIKRNRSSNLERPFYALDLPGFGQSFSQNSEVSIVKYSELLKEFILQMHVSKVSLVCHSMGGQVCINYALENVDHVQLLTLISPAGVYQKSAYINQTLKHYIGIGVGPVDHPHATSLGDLSWYSQSFVRRVITKNPLILMAVESFKDNFHQRIRQLKSKTLIIWGHDDPVFNFENGLYLKENIDGSTLYVIEKAGHFPLKSHAEYIAQLIQKFL